MSGREELEAFRVPVTVFTTVRGVDFRDAAAIAEVAIRNTLRDAGTGEEKRTLCVEHRRLGTLEVYVHQVMETGMAAGNGYLRTNASSKAYRDFSMADGTVPQAERSDPEGEQ